MTYGGTFYGRDTARHQVQQSKTLNLYEFFQKNITHSKEGPSLEHLATFPHQWPWQYMVTKAREGQTIISYFKWDSQIV